MAWTDNTLMARSLEDNHLMMVQSVDLEFGKRNHKEENCLKSSKDIYFRYGSNGWGDWHGSGGSGTVVPFDISDSEYIYKVYGQL